MKSQIVNAFLSMRGDKSPDAVIANQDLNRLFIEAARASGATDSDEKINRTLLNARKAGLLKGIKSANIIVKNQDDFRFASEIAIRYIETRDGIALDSVLCNPKTAAEFDEIAGQISPGFTSFEYRWAALNLRKRRRLRPELVARVLSDVAVVRHRVVEIVADSVPMLPGVYLFHDSKNVLYIGEAEVLFKRIKKHLDHSDNRGFARWLWEHGSGDLHLELHVLPASTQSKARKALEAEMIQSRRPIFNVSGIEK